MQSSAILRAEEVITARFGRFKPFRCVAAGDHVHLHAEGGHEEIVDHVFRGHGQAYRNIHWDVQLVDFTRSFGMLQVPHPLFAHDEDCHGALRRLRGGKKEAGPPKKKEYANQTGNGYPGDLQRH